MKINYSKKNTSITFLLLIYFFTQSAFSNEESGPTVKKNSFHLSLGMGAALKSNNRLNNNREGDAGDVLFAPIPLIQFSWGPVSMGAQGLTTQVYGNKEIGGYLSLNRGGDRYYATGMEPRFDSWFFGGGIRFHKFNILFARDINGNSKGNKISLHYATFYPLKKIFYVRSSIGIECHNKAFADYYYGVKASEVSVNRPEYHPSGYCAPTISFLPGYKYNEHLNFITGLTFKEISNQERKSPTTTDAWLEGALIAGALWVF
jgi:outer membrane protein